MSDAASVAGTFDLGPVFQVSYAVRDMDEAVRRFGALFGPFETRDVSMEGFTYRGRKGKAELRLAFARSGALEVELVQIVSGEFPQSEFLKRYGEGLHHVRFDVADLEGKLARMKAAGFSEVVRGEAPGVKFVFVESPDFLGDSMVELLEHS